MALHVPCRPVLGDVPYELRLKRNFACFPGSHLRTLSTKLCQNLIKEGFGAD